MKNRGFTILEALIAIIIITLLSALLFPTFTEVKRRINAASSMDRMRQIYVALEIYRNDYGGSNMFDSYRSYYTIGLPPAYADSPGWADLPGLSFEFWRSPCSSDPPDQFICRTAFLPGYCGHISYSAGLYDPRLIEQKPFEGNGNRSLFLYYIPTYKENIVIAVDPYCNPAATNMRGALNSKRGIALLLSGQVVNKFSTGDASSLFWYSRIPDW